MAFKTFFVEGIGNVRVQKSRSSKHLRLSVAHDGSVRVSMPYWLRYQMGVDFAISKADWLEKKKIPKNHLLPGAKIGKAHRLVFRASESGSVRTRITGNEIIISIPEGLSHEDNAVQESARKACIRALTAEAKELLPIRLQNLATTHHFTYASVTIKQLKSRWGSCSSKKDITLSCFLMQLSWKEIDYVLLHELTHTRYMSHSKEFWAAMADILPNVRDIKKVISQKKPIVINGSEMLMA